MARNAYGKAFLAFLTAASSVKLSSVYGRFAVYAGKTPCLTAVYAGRLKEKMNNCISNQRVAHAAHSSVYGAPAAYTSILPSTSRYTAMSFLVAGHRSSRFAPQRFGAAMRRAVSRRSHSCMRSGVVPGAHAIAYGSRCRSAVPAFTLSPAPSAADRASRMPAPHSVVVTASASCTAPAMLLAFSFRAVPMSRPCQHHAFKRHNTPLKSAPFGRSDAPQAARRLAAR